MGSRFYFQAGTKHARPIVTSRDYEAVKILLRSATVLGLVANRGEYRVEALIRELVEYESSISGNDDEFRLGWSEYVRVPDLDETHCAGRRWADDAQSRLNTFSASGEATLQISNLFGGKQA